MWAELSLELETMDDYLSELMTPEVSNSSIQLWHRVSLLLHNIACPCLGPPVPDYLGQGNNSGSWEV